MSSEQKPESSVDSDGFQFTVDSPEHAGNNNEVSTKLELEHPSPFVVAVSSTSPDAATEPTKKAAPVLATHTSSFFELPPVPEASSILHRQSMQRISNEGADIDNHPATSSVLELPRLDTTASEPRLTSEKSWVRRVQAKTDEMRKIFGLASTEHLMDDYICALKKRVLLQGRMYVFEHHICFYSSLFGHHKIKTIPFESVCDVRKRKNVGFPNSVEILWLPTPDAEPKSEFFTSFISREDAYRLLLGLWAQHTQRGRERLADSEVLTDDDTLASSASQSSLQATKSKKSSKMSKKKSNKNGANGNSAILSDGDVDENPTSPTDVNDSGIGSPLWSEPSKSGDGTAGGGVTSATDAGLTSPEHNNTIDRNGKSGGLLSVDTSRAVDVSMVIIPKEDGGNLSGEEYPEFKERPEGNRLTLDAEFDAAQGEAPPAEGMQRVLHTHLNCSPREFWMLFLSGQSNFFVNFHENQGHRNIRLDHWQQHYKVGNVRDLRFVSIFRGWRGDQQALCHQTQRYHVYQNDHVVFETSQVMSEIPYGDHFKVETRWDITPDGPKKCHLEVYIRVPFVKQTMWKRFIERSVTDNIMEALEIFKELAVNRIQSNTASHISTTATGAGGSGSIAAAELTPPPRLIGLPGSGDDALPESNEEWELLLSQVPPQWRDGLRSLRKVQLAGSIATPTRPSHRRRNSRGGAGDGFGSVITASSLVNAGSGPLPIVDEGVPLNSPFAAGKYVQSPSPSPVPGSRFHQSSEAGSGGDGFWSRNWLQLVLCGLLGVVMTLQLMLVVLQLRSSSNGTLAGAYGAYVVTESDAAAVRGALLGEFSSVLQQVQTLQTDAQAWEGRLKLLVKTAGQLTEHVVALQQQLERTGGD